MEGIRSDNITCKCRNSEHQHVRFASPVSQYGGNMAQALLMTHKFIESTFTFQRNIAITIVLGLDTERKKNQE